MVWYLSEQIKPNKIQFYTHNSLEGKKKLPNIIFHYLVGPNLKSKSWLLCDSQASQEDTDYAH